MDYWTNQEKDTAASTRVTPLRFDRLSQIKGGGHCPTNPLFSFQTPSLTDRTGPSLTLYSSFRMTWTLIFTLYEGKLGYL